MYCTNCGAEAPDNSMICPSCGSALSAQQSQAVYSVSGNVSKKKGMGDFSEAAFFNPSAEGPFPSGNNPVCIEQVKGLNWGAFWFSWIWLGNHAGWLWGIIALIISLFSGGFIGLAMGIFLLIEGNKIAWKFRSFSSVDECLAVQKIWNKWSWILVGGSFGLAIVMMTLAITVSSLR